MDDKKKGVEFSLITDTLVAPAESIRNSESRNIMNKSFTDQSSQHTLRAKMSNLENSYDKMYEDELYKSS